MSSIVCTFPWLHQSFLAWNVFWWFFSMLWNPIYLYPLQEGQHFRNPPELPRATPGQALHVECKKVNDTVWVKRFPKERKTDPLPRNIDFRCWFLPHLIHSLYLVVWIVLSVGMSNSNPFGRKFVVGWWVQTRFAEHGIVIVKVGHFVLFLFFRE